MRSKDTERWLTDLKVPWEFVAGLAVGDIDAAASLANQARLEPLDPSVVERYAADMERGDEFPPLLVRRLKRKLVALGGNHRLAAARQAKVLTFDAYLVDCASDEQALEMSYGDNRRHGLPPPTEERLTQALHLVATGYSHAAAARVVGVGAHRVTRAVMARKAAERADRLHLLWENVSESTLHLVGQLENDEVFALALDLCDRGVIRAAEVGAIVPRIRAMATRDALKALRDMDDGRTRRGPGRPPSMMRPSARLLSDLDGILRFDPELVVADCSNGRREALRSQIKAAARRLMAIDKALAS